MNLYWKKKWVEALRSGKYLQGIGSLRSDENHFCCLGVLCDITKEKLGVDWDENFVFSGRTMTLPETVMQICELSEFNPMVQLENGKHYALAALNDARVSFDIIANLIEASL